MLRLVLRSVIHLIFRAFTRLDILGDESIPRLGPAIVAANHVSILDAPLAFMLLKRDDVTGLVADKYQDDRFISWLVNLVDGIWINRGSADFRALRQSVDYLKRGGMLGIAPEGTRSHTGSLSRAKTGVAYLAEKAAMAIGEPVTIVPLAISGTDHVFHELSHLRRASVRVRVGESFTLPPVDRENREAALQRNTDEIMYRISRMLPECYRGVYGENESLVGLEKRS